MSAHLLMKLETRWFGGGRERGALLSILFTVANMSDKFSNTEAHIHDYIYHVG